MARTTRVDLHGRNALRLDLLGVHVAGDVALDDGDVELVAKRLDGGKDGGRLAGSGAGKQVEHEHVAVGEALAQLRRQLVVLVKDGLLHIDLHAESSY